MTFKELHEILEELKNTNSIKEKEIILSKYNNETFIKYLQMVFDKNIVFGIKKIPENIDINISDNITLIEAINIIKLQLNDKELRGHAARDFMVNILSKIDKEYRYIIKNMISKKINTGISEITINKALNNCINIHHYMGAVPFDLKKINKLLKNEESIYSQEKSDGRYCSIYLHSKSFISRQNKKDNLETPELKTTLEKYNQYFLNQMGKKIVINAEMLIPNISRQKSNGFISSILLLESKSKTKDISNLKKYKEIEEEFGSFETAKNSIIFKAWDIIPEEDLSQGIYEVPYKERLALLKGAIEEVDSDLITLVDNKTCKDIKSLYSHFSEIRKDGGEGTIVKSKEAFWKNGKRIWQIKLKFEIEFELKIVGFRQGDSDTKYKNTLGSYIVESRDGILTGKAGGLSEDEREFGWQNKSLIDKIITVKCNGLIYNENDGNNTLSMLNGVFIKHRDDKKYANTSEEIIEIEKSTIDLLLQLES